MNSLSRPEEPEKARKFPLLHHLITSQLLQSFCVQKSLVFSPQVKRPTTVTLNMSQVCGETESGCVSACFGILRKHFHFDSSLSFYSFRKKYLGHLYKRIKSFPGIAFSLLFIPIPFSGKKDDRNEKQERKTFLDLFESGQEYSFVFLQVTGLMQHQHF